MKKNLGGAPRKPGMTAIQIRIHEDELRLLNEACADLGMKRAAYVRTVLLKELSAAFPNDAKGKAMFVDQVAEIAGQVVRHLGRAEQIRSKKMR